MKFFNYFFKRKKRSKTIFIVEDNQVYAKALERFIRQSFPQVEEIKIFPAGEAAIMELKKNPCIIIMDHYLNSKYEDAASGLDAVREIKAKKPKIPIMLLSAQEDIGIAVEAAQKYNCRYIKKNAEAFGRVQEYLTKVLR